MKQANKILRGPDKVAALLLAMGKPLAGRLLKHFDPEELKLITRSVANLGAIRMHSLEGVIEEFAGQFLNGVDLLGSATEVEQLLTGVLTPSQIAELMAEVSDGSTQPMWERLSTVPDNAFANYLLKEHPQTAALILSKVSPTCAARAMALFPRDRRNALMRRMLSMSSVTEPAMRVLEATLREDLLLKASRNNGDDQNARMADIINKMEREQMEDVLQSLAETRPKTAETLRGLLFTFDDVIKLQPRARMLLFDAIPTERVVLALKGSDIGLRDAILSSLASRARRMVEQELSNSEPASHRDVLKARRMIADAALSMAERGEIELNSTGEDEEVY
ncbi:flagellar motor switch protein FliG [Methyloferula stellata]|uniref:flagellar motor switch protein FliG n=1 Tax=Methyloferula stellata TaxID=876270 RepID=UPI00035E4C66|nr:flagellar motor switch protein FliG [Methyloferula stellata]